MTERFFTGFSAFDHTTSNGVVIHGVIGGHGPPLLLLHGCPQSHVMWRHVAPGLAAHFTVVATDLRGYGDSSKPEPRHDHASHSFRALAADQLEVMSHLGFPEFMVAGHDRGARVAHRLALDHPERVRKAAMLDILPTVTLYEHADAGFARAYWEWFFFTQESPFPETLLSAAPAAFLEHELGTLVRSGVIEPEAWAEYLRVISDPLAIQAMCEDYRAGATIDLEHDREDAGRRIACPVLVLWGERNPVWRRFDMSATWRRFASDVEGRGLGCGHYLAEERPADTHELLAEFLTDT
jgi:haloacetate dehalogenase